jgi:hypothetical protein
MQDSCSSLLSFVRQSIIPPHVSTVVDQGRVSMLTGCVTTPSSCYRSPARLGLVKGVVEARRRLHCDQANGENTARSARASLKNGAAVRGSRLKIATDVADMLGSSEAPARTGRSFSLGRMGIDGAQRGTRSC